MGAVAMWYVLCDADPRSDECWWKTEDCDSRGEAQRLGRKDGWLVGNKGQENLCPKCRKVLGR